MHEDDRRLKKALARYQVISGYLAIDPPIGQRGALRQKLAAKTWVDADGNPMHVAAETIRGWVRRYRARGLQGLMDKPRPRPGVRVLTPKVIDLVCALRRDVPQRSIDRVIRIAEETNQVDAGVLTRSTVHRVLQDAGLSARVPVPDAQDLDRFEAEAPNDLWQSDLLKGPWLPDPERPGKRRRACLYAFLDDHSRMLLHGRFSFRENLPRLELVFRRSLQKYGAPGRCYYDNGAVYRSRHMRQIIAEIGCHGVTYTKAYRPMGHGKIEAFNRYCKSAFIAEVPASSIRTLDQLNEAFVAWADLEYNRTTHGETGEAPRDRWLAGLDRVRFVEEDKLATAFLWRESRSADKAGLFSLFGTRYQVGPELAGKRVVVRFDPEALEEVEVWYDDRFVQRVRPFEVSVHRRPRAATPARTEPPAAPTVDWLDHLVQKRRRTGFTEPTPAQIATEASHRRREQDDAVLALLAERLDPEVVDEPTVRSYLDQFGPFEPSDVARVLDDLLQQMPRDQHINVTLEAIRTALRRGAA